MADKDDTASAAGSTSVSPRTETPLKVSIHDVSAGVSVVHLVGELDAFSCGALRAELSQFINRGGRHLVLNLVELRHIDSAGLGTIIEAIHQVRARDGSIRLISPAGRVRDVFAVTRLDRILDIYATEHHALRFFLSA